MAVDVQTGEERMLFENARIGEIVFNPVDQSLMGVRHENGLATLVRIPQPYDTWYGVYTFPYGVVPVRPRHFARRAPALRRRWPRSTATSSCACGSSRRS